MISTAGGTGGRHPEGGIFPPARRGAGTAPVLHPALPETPGSTAMCHPRHSFFLHCNCHHINLKILLAARPSFHPRAPNKCTGMGHHALPSMRSRQRKDLAAPALSDAEQHLAVADLQGPLNPSRTRLLCTPPRMWQSCSITHSLAVLSLGAAP